MKPTGSGPPPSDARPRASRRVVGQRPSVLATAALQTVETAGKTDKPLRTANLTSTGA
jgi:hypothetical protein